MSEEKDKQEKTFDIPSDAAQEIASHWASILKGMAKANMFQGAVPEYFMAECLENGSLILRSVEMPKGIVMVSPVSTIPRVEPQVVAEALGAGVVEEEEEKKDTGRRKILLGDKGTVRVK